MIVIGLFHPIIFYNYLDASNSIKGQFKDPNALHLAMIILHEVLTKVSIRVSTLGTWNVALGI